MTGVEPVFASPLGLPPFHGLYFPPSRRSEKGGFVEHSTYKNRTPQRGFLCQPSAMKTERIPPTWRQLHPGDQVGSRLPYHRILRHFLSLESEGYKFAAWPSENGYWIVCQRRPT